MTETKEKSPTSLSLVSSVLLPLLIFIVSFAVFYFAVRALIAPKKKNRGKVSHTPPASKRKRARSVYSSGVMSSTESSITIDLPIAEME
ncbi:hypothetical protein NECID01_0799 [Nematocida sp. AWRm77]|nr:hypothetical protein NECID01_0799 [Nematocida sp. AWRm77]